MQLTLFELTAFNIPKGIYRERISTTQAGKPRSGQRFSSSSDLYKSLAFHEVNDLVLSHVTLYPKVKSYSIIGKRRPQSPYHKDPNLYPKGCTYKERPGGPIGPLRSCRNAGAHRLERKVPIIALTISTHDKEKGCA